MYRLRPALKIKKSVNSWQGFDTIVKTISQGARKIAIETFPGVEKEIWKERIQELIPKARIIDTDQYFISPEKIFCEIQDDLTDDPVFGRFSHRNFKEFIDWKKVKEELGENHDSEQIFVIGVCASEIIEYDQLVYMDLARWEIQLRMKDGLGNWRGYREELFSEKLKRAYYFEWPAADIIKEELLRKCQFYIDTNLLDQPKMISSDGLQSILWEFSSQPFRLVPYFDPGIWGGHWMQEKFDVGKEKINLAWSFDGVPEENSILADLGNAEIEIPAQNLVFMYPERLLGKKVLGKFGKDFPIRFDYLDTMDGQNLSLQVHPTLDYAYRNFGAKYTQDESYYILDSKEDASVYLGLKNDVEKEVVVEALEEATKTGVFLDEKFINRFPAKKHDHFLIPGGTIHSSGKNCVVLEISATPNRFTFKLWDWGRMDLDGRPRPISLDHGKQVINEQINEDFARKELINQVEQLFKDENFLEERTGLHESEFIETRRLTFSRPVVQHTENSVNMLNLVEGKQIRVVSENNAFAPFDVFYGETFIVPECVDTYRLEPIDSEEVKVMKAYVR